MLYSDKRHRILVGDIMTVDLSNLMDGEIADIVYSDPPWGDGNLKYWHTIKERHKGAYQAEKISNREDYPDINFQQFLDKFCEIVYMNSKGMAFVEMGNKWVEQLADTMNRFGIKERGRWTVRYRSGYKTLTNQLWLGVREGVTADFNPVGSPEGLHGQLIVEWALSSIQSWGVDGPLLKETIVLDPCCNEGMTGRVAYKFGMRFRGLELNPKRAAVGMDYFQRRRNNALYMG